MNSNRYILSVGETLNLNKPESCWLAKEHLEDKCTTYWILIKKYNGRFIICASSGKEVENRLMLFADQSRNCLGPAEFLIQFNPKTELNKEMIDKIHTLVGKKKSSFAFYVYK